MVSFPLYVSAAMNYIPRQSSNNERPLDWSGINPEATENKFARDQMIALAMEEQEWLDAGLISKSTTSSSEWPMVALLHACNKVGVRPEGLDSILEQAIAQCAPSVVDALVPLLTPDVVTEVLRRPLYNTPTNGALLFRLKGVLPVAKSLLSLMTPELLDTKGRYGRNLLFNLELPVEDLDSLLAAGVDPCVRDDNGFFPEEVALQHASLEDSLAFSTELNRHRPADIARLAKWRFAVAALDESIGSDPSTLVEEKILSFLEDPPTGVSLVEDLQHSPQVVSSGLIGECAAARGLHRWLKTRLERSGNQERWWRAPAVNGPLVGWFCLLSLHQKLRLPFKSMASLGKNKEMTPEEVLLDIFRVAVRNPETFFLATSPIEISAVPKNLALQVQVSGSNYLDLINEVFGSNELQKVDEWKAWLPSLEACLHEIIVSTKKIERMPAVVSLVARTLDALPASVCDTPEGHSVLLTFEVLRSSKLGGACKLVEKDGAFKKDGEEVLRSLDEKIEKAFSSEAVRNWWEGRSEGYLEIIKQSAPHLEARFKQGRLLLQAVPGTTQKSKSSPRF